MYRLYFASEIRIQVAQLKRLSIEGRFFCCHCGWWRTRAFVVFDYPPHASIVQVVKYKQKAEEIT